MLGMQRLARLHGRVMRIGRERDGAHPYQTDRQDPTQSHRLITVSIV
jgi:hypothetical protein